MHVHEIKFSTLENIRYFYREFCYRYGHPTTGRKPRQTDKTRQGMSKPDKKVTIKDVAQLAGVSKGTVDRVIHNRGEVSAESFRKVQEVVRKIDYKPLRCSPPGVITGSPA